ncbi:MAG: hypothetical protein IJ083_16740 [Clostridia bacterium]|nr:hypothetical protein [Clostridia bacterium]
MGCIATFDIGTTAVKAVLVTEDGQVLYEASREIRTFHDGGLVEQDPMEWWDAFVLLSRELLGEADQIIGIVMSGQMQDVIPVDEDLNPLGRAILYSDGRAVKEAEEIRQKVGEAFLLETTGNHVDGTMPVAKMLWLSRHRSDVFRRARSFLISSKDFVIARLTGETVGDVTACSTAGAMDLREKTWCERILSSAGVSVFRMPRLLLSHRMAGIVTFTAAAVTGYPEGTPVFAGAGDAGATTLASGIARPGQYNINLGTSGWVATVSDRPLFRESGIFNLAAMPEGGIINVVPFLNAGNVHRWVAKLFSRDGRPDYAYVQSLLERSVPGAHGVFALPYLTGERFPVLDANVRGSFLGVTPETDAEDMARAMMEGVAFSIRQGMEMLEEKPAEVSIIGGGGQVGPWCQIFADVLGQEITVFRDAQTLPARAIAASALIGLGRFMSYDSFVETLKTGDSASVYLPSPERTAFYADLYPRYRELYQALKGWFTDSHKGPERSFD